MKIEDRNSPPVSVIIPCRNEERFIGTCLDSIIANDYPKDKLEVVVVDGRSEDTTRAILENYAHDFPFIRVVDNPKKITPAALNIGIESTRHDIIIRMDAHACVEKDYISRSVTCLEKYGADNVGGIMKTLHREEGLLDKAISICLSHPFGVGNSYFRIHTHEPRWVDTVFGGCYRRDVFRRIGRFNENLPRGQDMEFNLRLKKAGGKTLLVPDIVSYYYARSDWRSFLKHNWGNGMWAILPFLYSEVMPVSWRHLIPLAFVVALLGALAVAVVNPLGIGIFLTIAGAYLLANVLASAQVARRERDGRFFWIMPLVFASLHFSYGLGSLWGVIKVLKNWFIKDRR